MRKFALLIFVGSLFVGCKEDPAIVPAYLHLDAMDVQVDYSKHGTASSRITTVWVEVDGEYVGVYELPATVPIAASGSHEITLTPGINLNGIQSLRNMYEFYTEYTETFNFKENKDYWPDASGDSIATVTYSPRTYYVYKNLEDFEDVNLAFETSSRSDTGLTRSTDPQYLNVDPLINETNLGVGTTTMPDEDYLFEVVSVEEFTDFPMGGQNVYLEMNYKIDAVVTVGVFRTAQGQVDQVPVVSLYPNDEWRKIYINLVSEVSAIPSATSFRIFIGGVNISGNGEKQLLFDNIKLVY